VDREDLINAIALNSSMFNGARIVGPAVAGLLVATIGEGWCFFANAVSYIAVIASLLLMSLKRRDRPNTGRSPWANIVEGFRFVATTAPVRALLLLLGVASFTAMPYTVLMPLFADQILHSGARGLGILMGASGAGALLGSIALAMRSEVFGLGRWVATSCAAFSVLLTIFAWSQSFVLSAIVLIPTGAAIMVQMASSNTLIQSMVPDEFRGRVMSVYSMMFVGMGPFGALLAGTIAEHAGAPIALTVGSVVTLTGAILFAIRLPKLRTVGRRLIIAQQAGGGEPVEQITATGAEE
jgi:MFS family permease